MLYLHGHTCATVLEEDPLRPVVLFLLVTLLVLF